MRVHHLYDEGMSQDLELAIHAAKSAGSIIREAYGKEKAIVIKGTNDIVTDTDVQAEHTILGILKRTGYSSFGEESGVTERQSARRWIVDPLDGTANFVRGFPFFAVSIALMEDEKNIVLGVVYDPIADECYWAEQGKGAYMNGRKIFVNSLSDMEKATFLIDHGKSEQHKVEFLRSLSALTLNRGATVLRQGATALMLCYVAKGSFDAFLSFGDQLYDYAAGLLIAEEAGADISDTKGNAWNTASTSLLVANAAMHSVILTRNIS